MQNTPPRKTRVERAFNEADKALEVRAEESGACRFCGGTDKMYHHGSPYSGICRSCSHKGQVNAKAEYTGETFNNHLVLGLDREKKPVGGKLERYWKVRCLSCGLESTREQGYLRKRVCHKCYIHKRRFDEKPKRAKRSAHVVFVSTQHGAYNRRLEFSLTELDVEEIISKPCSYCGIEEYIGIDRFKNDVGYTKNNSVPCCKICNNAKGTQSPLEFGAWLDRVHDHMRRNAPPGRSGTT